MGELGDDGIVPPPQDLLERLKDYGQEHCLDFWKDLSSEERDILLKNLESFDLPRINRIIKQSLQSQDLRPSLNIGPVPEASISTIEQRTSEQKERWWNSGLKAIADGKLAVLLLSGGQGTRLGTSEPKGCFNIGLPSGKSLFQLQAERILRLQTLATSSTNGRKVRIYWYIMTSPFTSEATWQMFEKSKYFGLEQEQVVFFEQGTLPCISRQGKFILEAPFQVSTAPDGNGGVYTALKASKCLDDMALRGIKYVDCFSVDNALVRVADPLFLGYVMEKGASCAAKVVKKAFPQERVGVFARRGKGGPLAVVEYSELDHSLAHAINQETGRLRFNWSNVCLHMFSLEFLNEVTEDLERDSIYHIAEKKIPSIEGTVDGIKLEQFVFDVFPYAPSLALLEVVREEEFAPVKNASGATTDTPDTARLLLLNLHTRWVVAAGGFVTHSVPLHLTGIEVSPLRSYAGENLEEVCRNRTFHAPCEIKA